MLQVKNFVFNAFEENTYVLFDETGDCVIIDPGCYDKEECAELADFIKTNSLSVKMLLNTHCHVDHVLGNFFVKDRYNVQLFIHELDLPVLKAATVYAPAYGLHQYTEAAPDLFLTDGEIIIFGNQSLKVLFVPGHAPGHIAFYSADSKIVIGGDVLFYQSVGRTDLPGGNYDVLIDSIHKKFFTLPDDVTVYPGHGPATTIGFEKKMNPFCALADA